MKNLFLSCPVAILLLTNSAAVQDDQPAAEQVEKILQKSFIGVPEVANKDGRKRWAETIDKVATEVGGSGNWLQELLRDPDRDVRIKAARALTNMACCARQSAPAILEAIKDSDPLVRAEAAAGLGWLGPMKKEIIPALIGALKDENHHVRRMAASSLGLIGPEAKDAVPALVALVKDKTVGKDPVDGGNVRATAAISLAHIGSDAKAAVRYVFHNQRRRSCCRIAAQGRGQPHGNPPSRLRAACRGGRGPPGLRRPARGPGPRRPYRP